MLGKENIEELRQILAHLSLPAVRDFYQQSYRAASLTVAFRARAGCRRLFRFGNIMEMALTSSRGKRVFLADATAQ
jgi:hypothetical protein